MALRRLLSGWLIAMAALARSVAQALERASEDRSAPAPDPVMAALAERYPGAPAHWLAHVAERTSQLAETGEAPLSLNSDPSAWPPARPDGLASPPPTPATAMERAPVSPDPRRSPPSRRDAAVPTLAALNDRSSEVWRRPEVEPRRRPRPVFASVAAAPASERSTATPEPGSATRRPRSPLTFVGSPSSAVPSTPEPLAPDASAPKSSPREAVWSEAPPSRTTFGATKAQPDVQGATERPHVDQAFAGALPREVSEVPPEPHSARHGSSSVARRQRSWFFVKSDRAGRSLELSPDPRPRAEAERADAFTVDPSPAPRATFPFSTSDRPTVVPERTWQARTPSTSRRSIFRALAALRAKSRRPQASAPTAAQPASSIDRPLPEPVPRRPAPSFAPLRAGSLARAAPRFPAVDLDAPWSPAEDHQPSGIADRAAHRSSIMPTASIEAAVHDRRPTFASARPLPSRAVASHPAGRSPDDRWPALPPTTITSPPGVEAPSPRWDLLAREQEEGRWSV
jgi:hypothetical protein